MSSQYFVTFIIVHATACLVLQALISLRAFWFVQEPSAATQCLGHTNVYCPTLSIRGGEVEIGGEREYLPSLYSVPRHLDKCFTDIIHLTSLKVSRSRIG